MRWSALLLVPLFVVACDREPVAPSVGDGPVLGSASNEWTEWVVSAPTEGWSWGPVAGEEAVSLVNGVLDRIARELGVL